MSASDLASLYPHLFNVFTRGTVEMQFHLLQAPPPDAMISNVNLVPFVGDKWVIIQVDNTFWELPGGTREPYEPHTETLRRELLEEAGARLKDYRSLGAWLCHSSSPVPYRPHLPHPDFYRFVSYGEVELVGKPLNPSDAEQVTCVELVTLDEAVRRFHSIDRDDFAELYTLAAWARENHH
ncbi:MAG: NUDIX domain-containing protein [Chloroflexi bacterium]|nr:NUDIX domain-containing protein [Chloroflexota bacterium]MCC6895080.1 NUDIX domain-containing protein [Anaerolineae bacterium]